MAIRAAFLAAIGRSIAVANESAVERAVELEVVSVDDLAGEENFAVIFHGPDAPELAPGIWLLVLGDDELGVYLSPTGRSESSIEYEAVFN